MDPIRDKLKNARSIAVLTGAGVSAESGISTFRGQGGMWRRFRAEHLATPGAFARDPILVWEWYNERRCGVATAQPNPGHHALAQLESRTAGFTLITQNVDDLHERAGSRTVLHLHGSIWRVRCQDCSRETEDLRAPLPDLPPRCACGGLLRPAVVWFGESLPHDVWRRAEAAASSAEVFLVVGTSSVVYPAAGLARLAESHGASVVHINLEPTRPANSSGTFLQGPSGEVLPQLLA